MLEAQVACVKFGWTWRTNRWNWSRKGAMFLKVNEQHVASWYRAVTCEYPQAQEAVRRKREENHSVLLLWKIPSQNVWPGKMEHGSNRKLGAQNYCRVTVLLCATKWQKKKGTSEHQTGLIVSTDSWSLKLDAPCFRNTWKLFLNFKIYSSADIPQCGN